MQLNCILFDAGADPSCILSIRRDADLVPTSLWGFFRMFQLMDLSPEWLAAAGQCFEQLGYLVIGGVREAADCFQTILQEITRTDAAEFTQLMNDDRALEFPTATRRQLAKATTTEGLTDTLLQTLGPLLSYLLGPIVHVSSTFHAQFKKQGAVAVDHGGYPQGSTYMEVHGAYLLHQDFTGATIPTSPSAVTCWVPLNSSPDWNLRVYPGSHRSGLLSSRWWRLDEPRLQGLAQPVDLQAKEGTAILFNALLLHGTSNPGPAPRVSCDIRFFPLCGYLPTAAHFLDPAPLQEIRRRTDASPVLQSPILESRAFLGEPVEVRHAAPHSVLNWPNYVACDLQGRKEEAAQHLTRFTNEELGTDPPDAYISKFSRHPVNEATIAAVRERLGATAGGPLELVG